MITRRTLFAFVALATCLVLALLSGANALALERDTGPTLSSLELVSHPAAFVLPVAIAPTAVEAEAHEAVSESVSPLNYEIHAPIQVARYESARSGFGRHGLRVHHYTEASLLWSELSNVATATRSNPLRC